MELHQEIPCASRRPGGMHIKLPEAGPITIHLEATHGMFRRATTKSTIRTANARRNSRRGTAATECALCLPIVVLITFGTIDISSALFLKESLTIAAYEGSRVGALQGGTDASAIARVQEILNERGISYVESSVVISSPSFNTAATLQHVTVTVQVQCQGNMPLTGNFFKNRSINASVTFRKEFRNLD